MFLFTYLRTVGVESLCALIALRHTHTRQNSSGWGIGLSLRPLPDNTQHSNRTNTHASDGIRTHNPKKWATADPRHRPHGQKFLERSLKFFSASSLKSKFSFYSSCYLLLLLFYLCSFRFFKFLCVLFISLVLLLSICSYFTYFFVQFSVS